MDEVKLYNVNIDVTDIDEDDSHMTTSTYLKKIKDTPIVSTPPKGPMIDKLKILMEGIIKRIGKWVES